MRTTYIRVYDLTKRTSLSGRLIKKLVDLGIITADAWMVHGGTVVPLFDNDRWNELVCQLMIYKEQSRMTKAKAEAICSQPRE